MRGYRTSYYNLRVLNYAENFRPVLIRVSYRTWHMLANELSSNAGNIPPDIPRGEISSLMYPRCVTTSSTHSQRRIAASIDSVLFLVPTRRDGTVSCLSRRCFPPIWLSRGRRDRTGRNVARDY